MLETALWAAVMDIQHFWIEGDCKRVIEFAQGQANMIQRRNQAIISEALRVLKSYSPFLGFFLNHRSSNQVADVLAKQARKQVLINPIGDRCLVFFFPLLSSNVFAFQSEDGRYP